MRQIRKGSYRSAHGFSFQNHPILVKILALVVAVFGTCFQIHFRNYFQKKIFAGNLKVRTSLRTGSNIVGLIYRYESAIPGS